MKITFESKGNFDVINSWLKKVSTHDPSTIANNIANEGSKSLAANTPRDTGATAAGWVSEVRTTKNITEITWKNTAHPNAGVNVAKLIHLGHGTGTGGYVAPRPYINKAIEPIFKTAGDKVLKELIK